MMSQEEVLDLLERAYTFGCFKEVIKLIRAGSDRKLIEVILQKAEERSDRFDPFNWDDFFGGD